MSVDALYRRVSFDRVERHFSASSVSTLLMDKTVANRWEFPLVLKYRHAVGRVHPFAGIGASVDHVSEGSTAGGYCQWGVLFPQYYPLVCTSFNETPAEGLEHPTAAGFVFAGGIDLRAGRLRLSPEIRYTRWPIANFPGSSLNQWQVLASFTL